MGDKPGLFSLTFFGIIGFAVGGAIGGAVWVAYELPHVGFAILGAGGGAALGAVVYDWRKKALLTGILAAVGYDIGFLLAFFILLAVWEPPMAGLFAGVLGGAIGGAFAGINLAGWKRGWWLALASAIGFGLAAWVTWNSMRGAEQQVLAGMLMLAAWGAIGGAFTGFTLGLLKRGEG
jgi:hypothetical protein